MTAVLSWVENEVFNTETTKKEDQLIPSIPSIITLNGGTMVMPSSLSFHSPTNPHPYRNVKTILIVSGVLLAVCTIKTCFLLYLPVLPKFCHLFAQLDIEKLLHHHILHPFQENQDAIVEFAVH